MFSVGGFTLYEMGERLNLAEMRLEVFVLVGDFLQDYFVLEHLQFMKYQTNYQLGELMVGYFVLGGNFVQDYSVLNFFSISEMGYKFPIGGDKLTNDVIDVSLEEQEGIQTHS